MKRQLTIIICVTLLVLALISCAAPTQAPVPTKAPPPTSATVPTTAPAPVPTPTSQPKPSTPAPTASTKPIELRLSFMQPSGGLEDQYAYKPWIKMIEDATNGRVKITSFGSAIIAAPPDQFNAAARGLAQMSIVTNSIEAGRFRLTNMATLPFMSETFGKEGGGLVCWELYQKFPEIRAEFAGTHLIWMFDGVSDYKVGSKKPIRKLEDVAGIKLRLPGGPPTSVMKALGAKPVSIDSGDIYSSMEKGVIDAWSIALAGAGSFKLQEVTKYLLMGGPNGETWAGPLSCVMNQDTWDSLPPDIQEVFNKFGGSFGAQFSRDAFFKGSDEALVLFKKAGVEVIYLEPQEFARWVTIAQGSWKEIVADLQSKGLPAQAVFDETLKLREKYSKTK